MLPEKFTSRLIERLLVRAVVTGSCFFFSSRRRHTRFDCDWSSDVCSSDLIASAVGEGSICVQFAQHPMHELNADRSLAHGRSNALDATGAHVACGEYPRSEERRVGKECRSRWSAYHLKKKKNNKRTVAHGA